MRAPISVLSICSARFKKLIFGRTSTFRSFSSLLEYQHFALEDHNPISASNCINQSYKLLPIFNSISAECIAGQDGYEDNELERVKSVLKRRGWNLGLQNSYFEIDLDHYNVIRILTDLFLESSDAGLALYFFRWSEWYMGSEHTVESMCTMVHILVAGNMNYKAVDLILRLVTKNCVEDWWLDLLLRAFHETHSERRVLGIVCSMLVDCYVKENLVNVGLKLAFGMKNLDIFPSVGVCNSLLRALLQSEQMQLAWDFLEEIQSHGLGFNVSIISLFIHKYCSEGNLENGWKLLVEMKHNGINADVVAYTTIIDSLCKMSLLREATCLLFKMTHMGICIDSVSVSSVIDGFCRVGKLEKAIIIMKIFGLFPNIYVYNSFISNFCMEGNMAAASHIFNEMLELGFHPDCFSYTTMIGGYCNIKDINASLNYLGKMLKMGIKPSVNTYTMLINGYCKSEDLEMAELVFQNMITKGLVPDLVAYNTLMNGYGKKGFLHKVFGLLDMMKSHGVSPDIVTYNTIIHSLILRGFVSEAKKLLDELVRRGFSPDVVTFADIISGFSKKGDFEEAFLVWFCMSEHHTKPDVVTCSALLNGYCRERRMEEANILFHKMLDVGLIPDLMLYNTLIHGFCSVGGIDDACHLVDNMVKNGTNPDDITYRALIRGYEKRGVHNPVEAAAFKLQQIQLKYDLSIDIDQHLMMAQQSSG